MTRATCFHGRLCVLVLLAVEISTTSPYRLAAINDNCVGQKNCTTELRPKLQAQHTKQSQSTPTATLDLPHNRSRIEGECGVRKRSSNRIVNGERAQDWPFFVQVGIISALDDQTRVSTTCGGTIISENQVLTAAHCVRGAKAARILVGDRDRKKAEGTELYLEVAGTCISKGFSVYNQTMVEDWAILYLKQRNRITFDRQAQPACLPDANPPDANPNSLCYVLGFGAKHVDPHEYDSHLQQLQLVHTECPAEAHVDTTTMTCFVAPNNQPADSCDGDSGGPVLCSYNNRWTLIGIVSHGSPKCDGMAPYGWVGVYTDVKAVMSRLNERCRLRHI